MDWVSDLSAAGEHALRLDTDLEFYAAELLKIRPKAGSLAPFLFNEAQRELHRRLEEQRVRTGKVRAIFLKARQVGISTYIAARFFRHTIASPGLRTAIIGHERAASRNLFGLVKRFHDNMPDDQKPSLGTSNAEELVFDKLDSGYLGVSRDIGRCRPILDSTATACLGSRVLAVAARAAGCLDADRSRH